MTKFCSRCGAELKETNWERYFCPNCGLLDCNQNTIEESSKDINYVG